jgi:hypothetical protein
MKECGILPGKHWELSMKDVDVASESLILT